MEQRLRLVQGVNGRIEQRSAERRRVQVPGQIAWKDGRGQTRMAAVVTRDVSEHGVSIECRTGLSIPLYRLVYFQIDRHARNRPEVPATLRKQSVLSAVFRVGAANDVTGTPTEYALRLLVEPGRSAAAPAVTASPQWSAPAECTA
jgi:hypothetical protein